jgi:1-phosphatidylinositol phosphodiesterase
MRAYSDDTKIVHMNLPGTHDAATWNYSQETQTELLHATQLLNEPQFNVSAVRCQRRSLNDMLNAGIRVFDLRYAYDITNTTLTFWHGPGLMSETATVDDVLFGFYKWLDDHPSEAVFLSFQYQGSTRRYASNDAGVQRLLYNSLTSAAAKRYILQTRGAFGTLGEARGKVTLLRRFVLDQTSLESSLPGVQFSPVTWIGLSSSTQHDSPY